MSATNQFRDRDMFIYVGSKQELLAYMDEKRVENHDEEVYNITKKVLEEKSLQQQKASKKNVPDIKTLLRFIKDLINEGHIEDGSGMYPSGCVRLDECIACLYRL